MPEILCIYMYIYSMSMFVVKWLPSKEMNTVTQVQILDDTVCITDRANTLKIGINPIILPPAIGK